MLTIKTLADCNTVQEDLIRLHMWCIENETTLNKCFIVNFKRNNFTRIIVINLPVNGKT